MAQSEAAQREFEKISKENAELRRRVRDLTEENARLRDEIRQANVYYRDNQYTFQKLEDERDSWRARAFNAERKLQQMQDAAKRGRQAARADILNQRFRITPEMADLLRSILTQERKREGDDK